MKREPRHPRGARAGRLASILLAAVLLLCCAAPAQNSAPDPAAVAAPARAITIRVTGGGFKWVMRYPGADGLLDSPDDVLDEKILHLPAASRVTLELRSDDYAYSFYVPDFELIEVALPGGPYRREFDSGAPGIHRLLGGQMCGYTHPDLLGDVVVQRAAEFDAWIAGLAHGPSSGASGSNPPASASGPAS